MLESSVSQLRKGDRSHPGSCSLSAGGERVVTDLTNSKAASDPVIHNPDPELMAKTCLSQGHLWLDSGPCLFPLMATHAVFREKMI